MNTNISYQIRELANSANQEILMREAASKHDIKSFSKTENNYSFEFKTTNSLQSPFRYVFKRRLRIFNPQIPKILITADFLDKELELYETRKENLHHLLVFMYIDRMIEFDMRDIRLWVMKEGPNPKEAQIRNKKSKDGSFVPCTEMVYYIPASVPRSEKNYILNEATRGSIYSMWVNPSNSPDDVDGVVTAPYTLDDQIRITSPQVTSISPYF